MSVRSLARIDVLSKCFCSAVLNCHHEPCLCGHTGIQFVHTVIKSIFASKKDVCLQLSWETRFSQCSFSETVTLQMLQVRNSNRDRLQLRATDRNFRIFLSPKMKNLIPFLLLACEDKSNRNYCAEIFKRCHLCHNFHYCC